MSNTSFHKISSCSFFYTTVHLRRQATSVADESCSPGYFLRIVSGLTCCFMCRSIKNEYYHSTF